MGGNEADEHGEGRVDKRKEAAEAVAVAIESRVAAGEAREWSQEDQAARAIRYLLGALERVEKLSLFVDGPEEGERLRQQHAKHLKPLRPFERVLWELGYDTAVIAARDAATNISKEG